MKSKKRAKTPMEKLTAGYEKLMKDKEHNQDGKTAFSKTLKKAATIKQRASK